MNVLIGCEESQEVCKAFRLLGHEAYSCDILPCSGGHPEWHLQGDIKKYLYGTWDLIISFPPCTDISGSGAKHFRAKRLSGEQEVSINFFLDVWEFSNCTENPKNIMSGWVYLRKWFPHIVQRMQDMEFPKSYTQVIHPYLFGHGEMKETWLWLKGVPLLLPTDEVGGRIQRIWREFGGKTPNRSILRSKTYPGVAAAMANQWGK